MTTPAASDLDGLRLVPFEIPMRVRFRRTQVRAGILIEGPAGWAEFSPFPEYDAAYAARWLAAAIADATTAWPDPVRTQVEVNAIIPALGPDAAAARAVASGCRTVKVKVAEAGESLAHDLDRVAAVRDAIGPTGRIRVDANAAWSVEDAVDALTRLAVYDLEYAEQPCSTLEELRAVRRRVPVALAADESVRTAEDPLRIAGLDAADVLVLKAQPLGGVARALEIAEATGLPVVVSSALESSVGLAAGLAFAAALPDLPFACGLGTADLLDGDVTRDPLLPAAGRLQLRRPVPDEDLLDRWSPAPDVARAMLQRLHDAHAAETTYR